MEKMAEVIRKGIEAAEHDLVQDSNDILMEEVSAWRIKVVIECFFEEFSPVVTLHGSIRDDPYWTSRKNSLELIELSSIKLV